MSQKALSAEVRDDNPYSRLMALQGMGVVANYAAIRTKCVVIVGAGGVGSVVAEMLTRCGVGRLLLFDYDTVAMANMNRLFYRPEQQGLRKVEAARRTLHEINPDTVVSPYAYDITVPEHWDGFVHALLHDGVAADTPVDLLLCCVDNFQARLTVNLACLVHNLPWMESGVAENAVSGHIQLLLPGVTACYECCPPLVVATNMPEAKREGVCAASLPTTMGIIAGFLAQNALKYLLHFGTVSEYVGYDAMRDHFPSLQLRANPDCRNEHCVVRQRAYAVRLAQLGPAAHPLYAAQQAAQGREAKERAAGKARAQASAKEWGITVEAEGRESLQVEPGLAHDVGTVYAVEEREHSTRDEGVRGVEYAYAQGSPAGGAEEQAKRSRAEDETAFVQTGGESVEELMARMRALQM